MRKKTRYKRRMNKEEMKLIIEKTYTGQHLLREVGMGSDVI